MVFKDKLAQAISSGNVKVGKVTEKSVAPKTTSNFSNRTHGGDQGLALALMNDGLSVKKSEKLEETNDESKK